LEARSLKRVLKLCVLYFVMRNITIADRADTSIIEVNLEELISKALTGESLTQFAAMILNKYISMKSCAHNFVGCNMDSKATNKILHRWKPFGLETRNIRPLQMRDNICYEKTIYLKDTDIAADIEDVLLFNFIRDSVNGGVIYETHRAKDTQYKVQYPMDRRAGS